MSQVVKVLLSVMMGAQESMQMDVLRATDLVVLPVYLSSWELLLWFYVSTDV